MSEIPELDAAAISRPAAGERDGPVFAEPWHAQLFALTVGLSEAGHYAWSEWAEAFAAGLQRAKTSGAPASGSSYYQVWLECLELLLAERGLAAEDAVATLKQAWTRAYLDTPHGEPVKLDR